MEEKKMEAKKRRITMIKEEMIEPSDRAKVRWKAKGNVHCGTFPSYGLNFLLEGEREILDYEII